MKRLRKKWNVIKKSPAEIEAMKEAGRISAKVLREVGARVEPGISTLELDHICEMLIRLEGGTPAFKGLYGFPGSICASVNDAIVHGIPSADCVLQEGDIISIDTGATVDGWVGDNAWTFPVGAINAEKQALLAATEESMWAGLDAMRAGNRLNDIGRAVQQVAEAAGFGVVRDYVGHGVGRVMHEDPNVPNYYDRSFDLPLEVGMVFAIEPMINMGTYKTRPGDDGWIVYTEDGLPSAHFEKMVALTEEGPEIITTEPDHKRPVND